MKDIELIAWPPDILHPPGDDFKPLRAAFVAARRRKPEVRASAGSPSVFMNWLRNFRSP
jgi:hypothetical protein